MHVASFLFLTFVNVGKRVRQNSTNSKKYHAGLTCWLYTVVRRCLVRPLHTCAYIPRSRRMFTILNHILAKILPWKYLSQNYQQLCRFDNLLNT